MYCGVTSDPSEVGGGGWSILGPSSSPHTFVIQDEDHVYSIKMAVLFWVKLHAF